MASNLSIVLPQRLKQFKSLFETSDYIFTDENIVSNHHKAIFANKQLTIHATIHDEYIRCVLLFLQHVYINDVKSQQIINLIINNNIICNANTNILRIHSSYSHNKQQKLICGVITEYFECTLCDIFTEKNNTAEIVHITKIINSNVVEKYKLIKHIAFGLKMLFECNIIPKFFEANKIKIVFDLNNNVIPKIDYMTSEYETTLTKYNSCSEYSYDTQYLAPELSNISKSKIVHTKESVMFSFGMIIKNMFDNTNDVEINSLLNNKQDGLLNNDPLKRICINQTLILINLAIIKCSNN